MNVVIKIVVMEVTVVQRDRYEDHLYKGFMAFEETSGKHFLESILKCSQHLVIVAQNYPKCIVLLAFI